MDNALSNLNANPKTDNVPQRGLDTTLIRLQCQASALWCSDVPTVAYQKKNKHKPQNSTDNAQKSQNAEQCRAVCPQSHKRHGEALSPFNTQDFTKEFVAPKSSNYTQILNFFSLSSGQLLML